MIDQTAYAPLKLAEYSHAPGSYYLMLTDDAMVAVMATFEACGRSGNGYDWETVARSAVRSHAPETADRLSYDPEAGTFIARSGDLEALRGLGTLLHEAFHDGDRLTALIREADPADLD
jgi:hypothetical protein